MTDDRAKLSRLGFSFRRGGTHTARSMMLDDLGTLLDEVGDPEAPRSAYREAAVGQNCLGKRSGNNRRITFTCLSNLYSLEPENVLFRALRFFWSRDAEGRPLLALLCAYARDPVLRQSSGFILEIPEGGTVTREEVAKGLDSSFPGRFSRATLQSTAQNVNGTWTMAGLLRGKSRKTRARARATAGSLAYSLFMGYLRGARGESMFRSEYVKLLDCSYPAALELATEASAAGWIVFNRVGNVVEASFPKLVSDEELEASGQD
ncbi:MAG: hypothetical protein LBQ79_06600 [Deltaproteobacteria bacterium]|jgi:hypothetical protein|nr:hypothetical protein [Deltaproteobacteria bacterium]